jgi:hypothetical protein
MIAVGLLYFANKERVSDIQDQRVAFCEEQNDRHDNTIKEIDKQTEKRKKELPARLHDSLDERRNSTVLLVNVLAPKRDCKNAITQSGN